MTRWLQRTSLESNKIFTVYNGFSLTFLCHRPWWIIKFSPQWGREMYMNTSAQSFTFLTRTLLDIKEMITHCSILAWRIPWTEEPGGLQSFSHKESDASGWLSTHTHPVYHRERRGRQRTRRLDGITDSTDMSVSMLWETVKDRDAWRAAVHGVAKSQTWLSDWTTTTTGTQPDQGACDRTVSCPGPQKLLSF